jgi:arylsulfatase A-like enzyme
LLASIGLAAAILVVLTATPAREAASAQSPPNIVVLTTDDQTNDSVRLMENVQHRLGDNGATFSRNYVNFSLCCPSRATFLTGQYAHNTQVLGNQAPEGGYEKFHTLPAPNNEANSLPAWLQDEGYHTGLIGKYLNGYEQHRTDVPPLVPPGWTEWHGTTKTYTYYNYEQAENFYDGELHQDAKLVPYGQAPEDYSTDHFVDQAVDFIDRRAPSSAPFFLWLTPLAPHGGQPNPNPNPPSDCSATAKPAPRHANAFDTEPLPQLDNFNEADVSDKPQAIQDLPSLSASDINTIQRKYRCRIESLLAEDEGVDRILDELKSSGELSNTYVIFTSDNGFFAGEHRVPGGKQKLYEESVRLPLIIRGPDVDKDVTVRDLATNADLAPTILDIAGATAGRTVDGRSLLSATRHSKRERGRELLIETQSYAAIHTRRYMYAEHGTGEKELYDLYEDPYELESKHADPAYAGVMAALAARLADLRSCSGESCLLTPALELRLSPGPRGSCYPREQRVKVRGEDSDLVEKAEFYVDGALAKTDETAPFEKSLNLPRGRSVGIRVRATLLDGRRKTLEKSVRTCG